MKEFEKRLWKVNDKLDLIDRIRKITSRLDILEIKISESQKELESLKDALVEHEEAVMVASSDLNELREELQDELREELNK